MSVLFLVYTLNSKGKDNSKVFKMADKFECLMKIHGFDLDFSYMDLKPLGCGGNGLLFFCC